MILCEILLQFYCVFVVNTNFACAGRYAFLYISSFCLIRVYVTTRSYLCYFSVENSEYLSDLLKERNIPHNVLNARPKVIYDLSNLTYLCLIVIYAKAIIYCVYTFL